MSGSSARLIFGNSDEGKNHPARDGDASTMMRRTGRGLARRCPRHASWAGDYGHSLDQRPAACSKVKMSALGPGRDFPGLKIPEIARTNPIFILPSYSLAGFRRRTGASGVALSKTNPISARWAVAVAFVCPLSGRRPSCAPGSRCLRRKSRTRISSGERAPPVDRSSPGFVGNGRSAGGWRRSGKDALPGGSGSEGNR